MFQRAKKREFWSRNKTGTAALEAPVSLFWDTGLQAVRWPSDAILLGGLALSN